MRELVRYLLKNCQAFHEQDWETQGIGFLRLRVGPNTRLHIWDSRLRTPGVSDVHDHTQWAFNSTIISGSLINTRYVCNESDVGKWTQATLNCGIGGGMIPGSTKRVELTPSVPEIYGEGDAYTQQPDEIHRTTAMDGTVTLLRQERKDTGTARVFYPHGSAWGDATPRVANRNEVEEVCAYALSVFGE